MFENLNNEGRNLMFLVGLDANELLGQIKDITLPVRIISIYAVGSRHYAWIQTTAKVKTVNREKNSNGKSS